MPALLEERQVLLPDLVRRHAGESRRRSGGYALPVRAFRAVLLVLLGLVLVAPAPASAAPYDYDLPLPVKSDARPAGFRLGPSEAIAVANRHPTIQRQRAEGPLQPRVARLLGQRIWRVDYFRAQKVVALARVDGVSGRVVG